MRGTSGRIQMGGGVPGKNALRTYTQMLAHTHIHTFSLFMKKRPQCSLLFSHEWHASIFSNGQEASLSNSAN